MRKLKLHELNRVDINTFKTQDKNPIVCVLDDIRSKHNVGSVFRTCDAFAIENLFLCGITPTPPDRDIHKTALGAVNSVNWEYSKSIADCLIELKNKNFEIVAIEQTDKSIMIENYQIPKNKPVAIVLGNEIDGVSDTALSLCDCSVEIPQYGTKHSLNVSVACGIILYSFTKP